jgi:hypothetical protein
MCVSMTADIMLGSMSTLVLLYSKSQQQQRNTGGNNIQQFFLLFQVRAMASSNSSSSSSKLCLISTVVLHSGTRITTENKQTYGNNAKQKVGIYAVLLHSHHLFIALHLLDMHGVVLNGILGTVAVAVVVASTAVAANSSSSSSSSRTAEDHVNHSDVACCKLQCVLVSLSYCCLMRGRVLHSTTT